MKNKPAKNKPVEIELYFRPKKGTEAEYTFYPTDEFKAENECDADDVGFFLRDTEVLYLVWDFPFGLSSTTGVDSFL